MNTEHDPRRTPAQAVAFTLTPRGRGYGAAYGGSPVNPYRKGSLDAQAWSDGYELGLRQRRAWSGGGPTDG